MQDIDWHSRWRRHELKGAIKESPDAEIIDS